MTKGNNNTISKNPTESQFDTVADKISNLAKLASELNLSELEIEDGNFNFKLKKHNQPQTVCYSPEAVQVLKGNTANKDIVTKEVEFDSSKTVSTPLGGTFYRAKSATSAPYVKEGDFITPGTIIGLVSACKNLNEIISDKSGKIVKIIAENETNVAKGDSILVVE